MGSYLLSDVIGQMKLWTEVTLIFKIVNTLLHTEVSEQKLNQEKFCVWKLVSVCSLNVAKI